MNAYLKVVLISGLICSLMKSDLNLEKCPPLQNYQRKNRKALK